MNLDALQTIEQLESFLNGSQLVLFQLEPNKDAQYRWIQSTLVKYEYMLLRKPHKGIVRRFLMKITGYSRQQVTRLIGQYQRSGRVIRQQKTLNGLKLKYLPQDIRLLAELDELHGTLNGIATKKLCERAYHLFGNQHYERLANISVSHLYNLRGSKTYKNKRCHYEKTKPRHIPIGERRKPFPNNQPGYIRIDTVHQGDFDRQKGVYHINAVDEVTQFQVVCTVEKISEHFLIPVLEQILDAFPFVIRGFHSDNGSEYINKRVAELLGKLLIEFTKSRPRRSQDNGLVESKNGSTVRKILGYSFIAGRWALLVNEFNQNYVTPYLNYHRPCLFSETTIDKRGKERKKYPYELMATPYEKFKSLPDSGQYLKDGVSFAELDKIAYAISDSESARQMGLARDKLFSRVYEQQAV